MHPWDVLGAESGRATPWQTIINVATSLAPGYSNWLINQNPLPAILHEARSDPTFSRVLHPVRNRQLQIREPDPSSWSHSLQKHSRGRPQQMSRTHVVTQYFLLDFETVARLQVDPELRTHPEEKPQPRRRVNRDPALAARNLADSAPTTGRTTLQGDTVEDLPGTPVLTITTASRIHGISRTATSRGLETLRAAGILTTESVGGGRRAYTARSVLDATIWAERHLASTHFSTRVSPPTHPVPEPVPTPGIPEKSRLCSTQLQKSLFQGQKQRWVLHNRGPPSTKHGFRDTAHSYHPFSPTHPCRCSRFVHHRKHRQPTSRTYPPSSEN